MGQFNYPVTFRGSKGEITVEAMVDTGAVYCYLPRPLLEQIGAEVVDQEEFALADGRVALYDIGAVTARINGKERSTLCIFGESDAEPLLGAYTLEAFLFGVDPVNKTLIPVRGKLLGLNASAGSGGSQGFERRARR